MRNLFIFLTSLLLSLNINAQLGNVVEFHEFSNGTVKLNWSFDSHQSFDNFKNYGITLKRQIFEQNHVVLPYNQQIASEITIASNIKPKSKAWMEENLSHPKVRALIDLLYDTTTFGINNTSPKLVDAVNKDKKDKMQHFMVGFLAGQDLSLATASGLGYIDTSVLPNYEYRYILTMTDSLGNNLIYPQYFNVQTYQTTTYSVPEIKAEAGINSVILRWEPLPDQQYTSYDIYRSVSGQNSYSKINAEPFIFMKMAGSDFNTIVYTDSIPAGTYYDYKIKGKTPVGTDSPFSNHATIKALYQPKVNFPLNYTDPEEQDSTITVFWTMPDSLNSTITHFNIYRSIDQDKNYVKINANNIGNTIRSYTDETPHPEGFYIVEAIAQDSNFYRTIPIYAQLKDSIPPVPPTGLTAKYYGKSKVVVSWAANTDKDIFGYRVLYSDKRNGNYHQITSDAVTKLEYTTETDPNDPRDSTYFKIFAVDIRGNYSQLSEAFGLKKPNIVPPAKPSLSVVKPDKNGIRISWKYSSSDDVVVHKLERKMGGTPTWENVLTIPNEDKNDYMPTDSTDYNFLDTTQLEQREYLYRLIAENDQYTNASSEPISVAPMNPVFNKSSNVSNFSIEKESIPAAIHPKVAIELNKLKKANPKEAARFANSANDIINIVLKWSYKLDTSVQDFQVYRSITGGATTLHRTIKLAEAMGLDPNTNEVVITEDMGIVNLSVKDKDLLKGRRYTYQILARHKDQSTSKLSNSLTLKIEK